MLNRKNFGVTALLASATFIAASAFIPTEAHAVTANTAVPTIPSIPLVTTPNLPSRRAPLAPPPSMTSAALTNFAHSCLAALRVNALPQNPITCS